VHSEVLHYGYALIMLVGIWTLLPGFVGRSRAWWLAALVIQFWHHIEHALLQGQVIAGRTLFGPRLPRASSSCGSRGSSCTCSTTAWCSFR